MSTTDPDATWAVKSGPAELGYYDNYLVDTTSRVILSVHATPALFSQETLAARHMLEHASQFGIYRQNLAADTTCFCTALQTSEESPVPASRITVGPGEFPVQFRNIFLALT